MATPPKVFPRRYELTPGMVDMVGADADLFGLKKATELPYRLHGHPNSTSSETPLDLREVIISSTPEGLRRLATHLIDAANEMERDGQDFSPAHFRPSAWPEIVIDRYTDFLDE